MRVLVGKTFGIGNAVLSIPMIKAIRAAGHSVDVLVGTGPDDAGARDVFENLIGSEIDGLYFNSVSPDVTYDVAVMAIPFDGRWKNGVHFSAKGVIDARSRPDPEVFGFHCWRAHEVEYQMENARQLGYSGLTPPSSFRSPPPRLGNKVYLGLGYKKDASGYWLQKHWGNGNYARFIDACCRLDPTLYFVTTGNQADIEQSITPIRKMLRDGRLLLQPTYGLQQSFDVVGSCRAYFGNDTGMMHVAASFDLPTFAMFGTYGEHGNPVVKNAPLCSWREVIPFVSGDPQDPESIAEQFIQFVRRKP